MATAAPAAGNGPDPLAIFKLGELKNFCRERGLPLKGNKPDLIARIRACTTHELPVLPSVAAVGAGGGRRRDVEFKRNANRKGDPNNWIARPQLRSRTIVDVDWRTPKQQAWREDATKVHENVASIVIGGRVAGRSALGLLSNRAICVAVGLDKMFQDLVPLVNESLPLVAEPTNPNELTSALCCAVRACFHLKNLENSWPWVTTSSKHGTGCIVDQKLTPARVAELVRALTTNPISIAGSREDVDSYVAPSNLASISHDRVTNWLNDCSKKFTKTRNKSVTVDDLHLRSSSKGLITGIDVTPTYIARKDGYGVQLHVASLTSLSMFAFVVIITRGEELLTKIVSELVKEHVADVTTDRGYTDLQKAARLLEQNPNAKWFGVLNDVRKRPFTVYDCVNPEFVTSASQLTPTDGFEILSMPFMGPAAYVHVQSSNPAIMLVTVVTRTAQTKGKHGAVSFMMAGFSATEVEREAATLVRIPLPLPPEEKSRHLFVCTGKKNDVALRITNILLTHASPFCAAQGSCNAWGLSRRMWLTAHGATHVVPSLLGEVEKDNVSFEDVRAVVVGAALPSHEASGSTAPGASTTTTTLDGDNVVEDGELVIGSAEELDDIGNPNLEENLAEAQLAQEREELSEAEDLDDGALPAAATHDDDDEVMAAAEEGVAEEPQTDETRAWVKKAHATLFKLVYTHANLQSAEVFNGKHCEARVIRKLCTLPFVVKPRDGNGNTCIFYLGAIRNKLNPNFGYSPDGLCMTKFESDPAEVLTTVECKTSKFFPDVASHAPVIVVSAGSPEYHVHVPKSFKIQLLHQAATTNSFRTLLGMTNAEHMSHIVVINYTVQQLTEYRALMDLPHVRGLFGWLNDAPANLSDTDVLARLDKTLVSHYHYAILSSYVGIFRALQRYHTTLPPTNPVIGPTLSFRNAITDKYDCEKGATDDVCTTFKSVVSGLPFSLPVKGKLAFASIVLCASTALRAANVHRAWGQLQARANSGECDLVNFRRAVRGEMPFRDQLEEVFEEIMAKGVVLGTVSLNGFVLAPVQQVIAPATPITPTWAARVKGTYSSVIIRHLKTRAEEYSRAVSDLDFLGSSGLPLADACIRGTPGEHNLDPALNSRGPTLAEVQRQAQGISKKYHNSKLLFWNEIGGALRRNTQLLHLKVPIRNEKESKYQCFVCMLTQSTRALQRAAAPVACGICEEVTCDTCFDVFHQTMSFVRDREVASGPSPETEQSVVAAVSAPSSGEAASSSGQGGQAAGRKKKRRGRPITNLDRLSRQRARTEGASSALSSESGATSSAAEGIVPVATALPFNLNQSNV
jgi:hypothetical protein